MKRVIKNNNKIIIGILIGVVLSVTTVNAVDAFIESNKVAYDNSKSNGSFKNVQESIDELYEKSGMHKEKWVDDTLNGADPVLKDPLIPVEIKPNGDVYYASLNSEWYNYSEKRWANAVILIDEPSNANYKAGDHILESDIESYFVWIPRYSYKIWNEGKYSSVISTVTNTQETSQADDALWRMTGNSTRIIDVKFVGIDTTETGSTVGTYLTHPAFKLGDKDLNGIWVGKFETGGTSANDMVVKPNVVSWRNETVRTFFDAAKKFTSTELDSHMMKNTEWGAVAYISHSQYGIGNEVNINNASDYYTGYSAASNTNQGTSLGESAIHTEGTKTQPWNTPIGYLASTTGNISGIYDMSGGAYEYMAACKDGNFKDSRFDAQTLAQEMVDGYIDKYNANSAMTTYNNRILGDATGEMGPFYSYFETSGPAFYHSSWYGDLGTFVDSTYPWFRRGGGWDSGVLSGQFFFIRTTGDAYDHSGFRLVLAPTI